MRWKTIELLYTGCFNGGTIAGHHSRFFQCSKVPHACLAAALAVWLQSLLLRCLSRRHKAAELCDGWYSYLPELAQLVCRQHIFGPEFQPCLYHMQAASKTDEQEILNGSLQSLITRTTICSWHSTKEASEYACSTPPFQWLISICSVGVQCCCGKWELLACPRRSAYASKALERNSEASEIKFNTSEKWITVMSETKIAACLQRFCL